MGLVWIRDCVSFGIMNQRKFTYPWVYIYISQIKSFINSIQLTQAFIGVYIGIGKGHKFV